ncbi:MAG: hypothetical protein V4622_09350 [Bacteroidota bacterium]
MKNLALILFLLVNLFTFSQTKQIAHKSHSGRNQDFIAENYTDNFGAPPQEIKSITYLKNNCVLISYSYPGFYRPDSICNHPNFSGKYTLEEIKAFYTPSTEFIGFEKQFFNDSLQKPKEKPKQKRNSFYLFALIGFIGGGLIVLLRNSDNNRKPSRKLFTQKIAILILLLSSSSFIFSQTKQIAHKSHSGTNKDFVAKNYNDNFGAIPLNHPTIQSETTTKSVKLIKNNCVIVTETYKIIDSKTDKEKDVSLIDTLCNHPYFSGQYTFDEIKTFYLPETKFIGFENKFFNDSIPKKIENPKQKRNSFYLFALIGFIGGGLLVSLAKTRSRKTYNGLLIVFLFTSFITFSQTKQIAHKSHSGKNQDFITENYNDNFGLNKDLIKQSEKIKNNTTKTIKLIKNNCVILIKTFPIFDTKTDKWIDKKIIDTLCNHPYFSGQYTFEQIKTFYLPETKFIGFEKQFFNDSLQKPIEKPKQKRNSFYLFALIGFMGGGLIILLAKIQNRKLLTQKRAILILLLSSSSFSFSQTKQIAHKSHSGGNQDFVAENYSDNFGVIAPRVKEIKLLENKCIVEILEWGKNDTVCDHPYFTGQYTLDEIKTFYPTKTKFTGFEGHFFNHALPNPPPQKTNYIYIFAIIGFIGGNMFLLLRRIKTV